MQQNQANAKEFYTPSDRRFNNKTKPKKKVSRKHKNQKEKLSNTKMK